MGKSAPSAPLDDPDSGTGSLPYARTIGGHSLPKSALRVLKHLDNREVVGTREYKSWLCYDHGPCSGNVDAPETTCEKGGGWCSLKPVLVVVAQTEYVDGSTSIGIRWPDETDDAALSGGGIVWSPSDSDDTTGPANAFRVSNGWQGINDRGLVVAERA